MDSKVPVPKHGLSHDTSTLSTNFGSRVTVPLKGTFIEIVARTVKLFLSTPVSLCVLNTIRFICIDKTFSCITVGQLATLLAWRRRRSSFLLFWRKTRKSTAVGVYLPRATQQILRLCPPPAVLGRERKSPAPPHSLQDALHHLHQSQPVREDYVQQQGDTHSPTLQEPSQ